MPPTLLDHRTDFGCTKADDDRERPASAGPPAVVKAAHWSAASLPSRLNEEWARLCDRPDNDQAVRVWATAGQGRAPLQDLAALDGLCQVVDWLQDAELRVSTRDAVLVGLLVRAQAGDRLAGRVVLQTMLPAAVRVARAIADRPDVRRAQDEAFALALAALWQVIATYPVTRRPEKVTANLYLDMLAIVRRGHTSSTHRSPLAFPERAFADVRVVADPAQCDASPDELAGPPDAQLCTLLAWAVRSAVVQLPEARLLIQVYGLDGRPAPDGPALAAQLGVTWPTLRQRCHRIARRIGAAATDAGICPTDQREPVLRATGRHAA